MRIPHNVTGLLVSVFSVCFLVDCKTLKALYVLQRHGDRAPSERAFAPGDPYRNATYWPNGFGQLTDRGRNRMFEVGQFLRERYANFLTDDLGEVSVRSSAIDRCQETGQWVVSGAYRANNRTNELRSVPVQIDKKMLMLGSCPNFESKKERVLALDEIKQVEIDHQALYDYLTLKSGVKVDHCKANCWTDAILSEISEQLPLLSWFTAPIVAQMREMKSKTFLWTVYTPELKRLVIGLFLDELKRKLENFGDEPQHTQKLNLYETHDTMITALLVSLGVDNGVTPPFGATVIFELHAESNESSETKNTLNKQTIRMFYLNETKERTPHRLQMAGCKDACTVEQFVSFIAPLAIDPIEFDEECKLTDSRQDSFWTVPLALQVCSVLFSVLMVGGVIMLILKRNQAHKQAANKTLVIWTR